MEKNAKKGYMVFLLLFLLPGIFLFSFLFTGSRTYLNPVQNLGKESNISNRMLKQLNKKLMTEYQKKKIDDENILYLEEAYKMEDGIYIGRFVDSYPIMYEFSLDTTTNEVKLVEVAKRKLDEEEHLEQEAGFDPSSK